MKQKIIRILTILLPLSLGVFLIIYSYKQLTPVQLNELKDSFKQADYKYVYAGLFIGFTAFVARAYRWKYTLSHLGYTAPFPVKFSAVCITYLMNMTIPRSGEVSRALVLKRYAGVPFDKGLGTIIAERMVDLVILLLCMGGTILLQFGSLKDYLVTIPYQKLLVYGSVVFVLLIASVLFYIYSKAIWLQKVKVKISGLVEGTMSIFKMPNKWPFLLLSFYIWITYILVFYVTIYCLPQTAGLSFSSVATTFVIGSLAITFSNGGLGVFPVAIANVLVMYNVPYTAGTAFGWIMWASQIILIVFLGSLSFLLLPLFYRKK